MWSANPGTIPTPWSFFQKQAAFPSWRSQHGRHVVHVCWLDEIQLLSPQSAVIVTEQFGCSGQHPLSIDHSGSTWSLYLQVWDTLDFPFSLESLNSLKKTHQWTCVVQVIIGGYVFILLLGKFSLSWLLQAPNKLWCMFSQWWKAATNAAPFWRWWYEEALLWAWEIC